MNQIIPSVHTVSFHGTPVQVLENAGSYYIPMKPLCKAMGLDWKAQHKLIQRDPILSSTVVIMTIVAQDGKLREMTSLPIEYLNGWLFKLDISRYAPDMQEILIRYQKECYRVLFVHFFYALPNNQKPTANNQQLTSHNVREAIEIANAFGFVGNQGLLSANRMVRKLYGQDCLDLLGQKALICENQERHLTPTEIGKIIGGISAQKVNLLLEEAGIIESYRDTKDRKKWRPTEKGKPYVILKDTDKKHGNGTPIQQIFFLEPVIGMLGNGGQI